MTRDDGALAWLWGARVERVDGPSPELFSLTLYQPGEKGCLVLAVGAAQRGIGATSERPKGEAASAYVRRLRTKLENARVLSARWLGGDEERATALALSFQRKDGMVELVADFDAQAPALLLLGDGGRIAGSSDEGRTRKRFPDRAAPYVPPGGRGIARVHDAAALQARGAQLLAATRHQGDEARIAQARSVLRSAHKKAARKADAIRGDIERAAQAPRLRREADLLYCHLQDIPRGTEHITLRDESVDPPEDLTLRLDPAEDARRNAERRYDRARKLDRGAGIAAQRLDEAERELARLDALLASLESGDPERAAEAFAAAGLGAARGRESAPRRREPRTHVAFRTFVGTGGQRILVGKGAGDNDTLTLTVARPHDLFLHVRGSPGAHVIVPRDRGATISAELLVDAAHLAAHFSATRGEALVEVSHTERRYVRKPKGAAPGSVNVDREKVLLLRVEPARLAHLLAAEKREP